MSVIALQTEGVLSVITLQTKGLILSVIDLQTEGGFIFTTFPCCLKSIYYILECVFLAFPSE